MAIVWIPHLFQDCRLWNTGRFVVESKKKSPIHITPHCRAMCKRLTAGPEANDNHHDKDDSKSDDH